jgi:hypothetical protein
MPRTSSLSGLGELLAKQSSVASRGQLLDFGMKDTAMQYRVRVGGPWQVLLPGVYLAASGIASMSQKELAALLYAGPDSIVTGPIALMHHSIRSGSAGDDIIDVLVPANRQRLSTGFVADAVQLGRCTVGQLAEELRAGPVKGSAMFRSVLSEVADGVRSTAEGDLHDVITSARLPMPLFNPSLYDGDVFLGKPDAWWPDAGVAGEVDSREWHLSPEEWDRTRRRHDLMAAAGIILLHFSPREIRREPAKVARMIRNALDRGLARPPLPIRTISCAAPIR